MSEPPEKGPAAPGRRLDPDAAAGRRLDPDAAARHRLDPDAGAGRRLDPDTAAGHRLDPEAAAPAAGGPAHSAPAPAIDTRPYRWMIGIFGLLLVLIISVYQFVAHGVGTVGVPAGKQLHYFAAPLANSTLQGDANLNPPCTAARHDPRALNTCLMLKRAPLVLAFFVAGSRDCEREVDTLQALSRSFHPQQVGFAAVAVHAGRAQTAALIRSHGWTIPVAYDRDGAVGVLYGVETCPMIELARKGGIVADRLIGDHWLAPAALGPRVRALAGQ